MRPRGALIGHPLVIIFSHLSMFTGTIKKKIQDKGFGFITREGDADVFFHLSACNGQFDALQLGAAVQFDVEDSPKGKRAVNVTAIV
jgi:cold shock protein